MSPSDSSSSSSANRSETETAVQRFSEVRMPVDVPADDPEEAVERLRQCSRPALRRARKHHRRALESLRTGGYSALSEATRRRLTDRLRSNLEALNQALEALGSAEASGTGADAPARSGGASRSATNRLRAFVRGLW
jgi:BRCT domain type II-containing protein